MNTGRILIIDDDETFNAILSRALTRHGLNVASCLEASQALDLATSFAPDAIILDLRLGDESGLQLIKPLLEVQANAKILVLTGYASLATAVQAIKLGAMDYLPKPVDAKTILNTLDRLNSPEETTEDMPISDEPISLKRLEWEQIQRVLNENNGNISSTAKQLGMYRRTLQRKLQKKPVKW